MLYVPETQAPRSHALYAVQCHGTPYTHCATVPRTVAPQVAAAASGKGGGFLARDWGSGPTTQLHKVSFALHAELAETLGVNSYRKIPVLRVSPGKRTQAHDSKPDPDPRPKPDPHQVSAPSARR